jgi:transcriptional regulator of acetoin/glycerol metabolism
MAFTEPQPLPPLVLECEPRQWEAAVLRRQPYVEGVSPLLLQSWRRCIRAGISPTGAAPIPVLSGEEYAVRLEKSRELIQHGLPTTNLLQEVVRGTDFLVVLTDAGGCILKVMGDEATKRKAVVNNFVEKGIRDFNHAGTCGIALCLEERRPVQLSGAAHFRRMYHGWTCSTAPIFRAGGDVIGGITLAGPTDAGQLHTLGLTTTAAANISGLIRESSLSEKNLHLSAMLETIHGSLAEGIIALDVAGRIINVNAAACAMMGLAEKDCIGRNFITLASPDENFEAILKSRVIQDGQEATLRLPSGVQQFVCRMTTLKSPVEGILLALSEKQTFLEVSRRIRGYVAKVTFNDIIGSSPEMERQKSLGRMAAQGAERVIISGESGTGKELFAQAIHNAGPRQQRPFVPIACPTLPVELVEAELFGYEHGAFTGARREGMAGKLEQAHGGTLFLDEINSLPCAVQAKLLRVLQEKEIVRIGGSRLISVDVFVIAASNADLWEAVRMNAFREDLYYRLNEVELAIPPLRERMDDFDLLCAHILRALAAKNGYAPLPVHAETRIILRGHTWPGNVRELENVLKHASLLAVWDRKNRPEILPEFLPRTLFRARSAVFPGTLLSGQSRNQEPGAPIVLRDHSLQFLRATVASCGGNMTAAAKSLGISRSTLYRKLAGTGSAKT